MKGERITDWLLRGDISIRYQVYRDLLGIDRKDLQEFIGREGWGKQILEQRKPDGHWGIRFYQPKWISTHYTLLDLRLLNLAPDHPLTKESIHCVLQDGKASDGGIPLGPSTREHSDVCVNGMFLNYGSYFKTDEKELISVVDSILNEIMPDGGFNCRTIRTGARHSSLHTTLSVIEGLYEFQKAGYAYRMKEIQNARECAEEFILRHRLFKSDRTGQIIHRDFFKLTFPGRWKYDILRAMDYFRYSNKNWDDRMSDAVEVILDKQNRNGSWPMQAAHPGKTHIVMEKAGEPSRWNTLRCLRVLNHFGISIRS